MPDLGSDVVYGFIKDAVASEEARKSSIEQRGAAIVTTIGALVTLLFGLVAVITNATSFKLPSSAHGPLFAALISFVVAAGLGIFATVPLFYKHANADELNKVVMGWDGATSSQAQRMMSLTYLDIYQRQLSRNTRKALFLVAATIAEVVGLAFLGLAVANILTSNTASSINPAANCSAVGVPPVSIRSTPPSTPAPCRRVPYGPSPYWELPHTECITECHGHANHSAPWLPPDQPRCPGSDTCR